MFRSCYKRTECRNASDAKIHTMKKYIIGFALFLAYYLVAENLKNKIDLIQKLTNVGSA